MARVKLIQKNQAPPKVEEFFRKIEENGARVMNLYKAVAATPSVLPTFIKLGSCLLNQAELSPKLRELAILRVAKLTGSEYEWTQHVYIALDVGIDQQKIDDIYRWKESPSFSEEERVILQYADEVAVNIKVSDKTFEALRRYLSERQIVELTLSIGYWAMVARVLVALEVEIDEQPAGSVRDLLGNSRRSQ